MDDPGNQSILLSDEDTERVVFWLPRGCIVLDDLGPSDSDAWSIKLHYFDEHGNAIHSTHFHESYEEAWRDRPTTQLLKLGVPIGDWDYARPALLTAMDLRLREGAESILSFLPNDQAIASVFEASSPIFLPRPDGTVLAKCHCRDAAARLDELPSLASASKAVLAASDLESRFQAAVAAVVELHGDSHALVRRLERLAEFDEAEAAVRQAARAAAVVRTALSTPPRTLEHRPTTGNIYVTNMHGSTVGAFAAGGATAHGSVGDAGALNRPSPLHEIDLARSALELLPKLHDRALDANTKAQTLLLLRRAGLLDEQAAVDVLVQLRQQGIDQARFTRATATLLPQGVTAIAKRGYALSNAWYEKHGSTFSPLSVFDPDGGKESLPPGDEELILEARAWHHALLENRPVLETGSDPLGAADDLYQHFRGLFILLRASTYAGAKTLSRSSRSWLALMGNMDRVLFDGNDTDALLVLEPVVLPLNLTFENLRFARVVVRMLREFGPSGGNVAVLLARVLVAVRSDPEEVEDEGFWWKWDAGEALWSMGSTHVTRIAQSESVLVAYVHRFARDLANAQTEAALDSLCTQEQGGKLARCVVGLLGLIKSSASKAALTALLNAASWKFRYFPFLEVDAQRAL